MNPPTPLLLVLSAALAACAAAPRAGPSIAPGIHTGEIAQAGDTLRYRLFLPETADAAPAPPLLMLLHGCTQDAEDIARGTRMDAAARELGVAVLYPEQSPEAHPMRCWNWYLPEHQGRGSGELRLLAALAEETAARIGSDPDRLYVAGISAGGAAALAFTAAYPERVAAAAVHSALPYGVAQSQEEALAAMSRGPEAPEETLVSHALLAMGERARAVPLIVFHGADDPVVSPANASALARQWRGVHEALTHEQIAARTTTDVADGRRVEITTFTADPGAPVIEARIVEGLGHAWSGGSLDGSYTDPAGPDATREILRFLLAHRSR